MADIDVVPKHRNYTWLWVLLAVIVIAALMLRFAGQPREAAELLQDGQRIGADVSHFSVLLERTSISYTTR